MFVVKWQVCTLEYSHIFSWLQFINFHNDASRTDNFQTHAFLYLWKRQLNDYFLITFY